MSHSFHPRVLCWRLPGICCALRTFLPNHWQPFGRAPAVDNAILPLRFSLFQCPFVQSSGCNCPANGPMREMRNSANDSAEEMPFIRRAAAIAFLLVVDLPVGVPIC